MRHRSVHNTSAHNPRASRPQQTADAPARVHAALIYLMVALFGVVIASGVVAGAGMAGALIILVGAGGCAWEVGLWTRERRKRRAAKAQARAHAEHKQVRRGRQAQERAQQQELRQIRQRALHGHEQRQRTDRQAKSARAAQTEAQRLARYEQVTQEAARLQPLEDALFLRELPSCFAQRGLRLERDSNEQTEGLTWDMQFLRLADESREVARCLPQGRSAAVADVEALEQWRVAVGATHAYLVGRNGFSAAALRLAPRFPITLVEPQLLAQWNTAAMQKTPE